MISEWFTQTVKQHQGKMWLLLLPWFILLLAVGTALIPAGEGFPRETVIQLLLCLYILAVGTDTYLVKKQKTTAKVEWVFGAVAVVVVLVRSLG